MFIQEIQFDIDIKKILLEMKDLPKEQQVSLQGTKKRQGDYLYGTGRIVDIPDDEKEFTIINFPQLNYINSIIDALGLFRTRIMTLPPYTCYSTHRDPTKRVHIPISTHRHCFFVSDGGVTHTLAPGKVYLVDTRMEHTFVNSSPIDRIHIIGCVSD